MTAPDEYTEAEWLGLKTGAPLLPYSAYVETVHDFVWEGDDE
jgi:hypothetical protein